MNKKIIFLLDIDGVLADYAGAFCEYHNWLLFKQLKPKDIPKIPFNEALKYDKKLYDCIKYLFRISGGEAKKPNPIKGGKEFTEWAIKNGHKVFIWTTRPVIKFPNLIKETKEWLKLNRIKYDKLFFTDKMLGKELFAYSSGLMRLRILKGYKLIAVDDFRLLDNSRNLIDKLYIFNQPYNKEHKGQRINNLLQLKKIYERRT